MSVAFTWFTFVFGGGAATGAQALPLRRPWLDSAMDASGRNCNSCGCRLALR